MIKPKITTLKNGLRILAVPMPDNQTVTVLTLVAAGSHYEPKEQSGLSHFLEHMCFKGTKKRPTALSIAHELDALGAQSNAFTGNEYTGYYAKGAAKLFPKLLDVVSDIYLNSTFPESEIEKEKGVVAEEIRMYEDMPDDVADENLLKLMYGDQPAGRSIAGDIPTVRSFDRKAISNYHARHYVAAKTVVVIAGGIPAAAASDAKKAFSGIAEGKVVKKPKVSVRQAGERVMVQQKPVQQTHAVFGFRGYGYDEAKERAATLLGIIMGGGMSSRLFQILREERGLCYYVSASHQAYAGHGYFRIAAGIANDSLPGVIETVMDECRRAARDGVTPEELRKAKDMVRGYTVMALESSNSWATFYGSRAVLGRQIETPEKALKKIEAVTVADIKRVAKELFSGKRANLSVVGPDVDEKKVRELFKF